MLEILNSALWWYHPYLRSTSGFVWRLHDAVLLWVCAEILPSIVSFGSKLAPSVQQLMKDFALCVKDNWALQASRLWAEWLTEVGMWLIPPMTILLTSGRANRGPDLSSWSTIPAHVYTYIVCSLRRLGLAENRHCRVFCGEYGHTL